MLQSKANRGFTLRCETLCLQRGPRLALALVLALAFVRSLDGSTVSLRLRAAQRSVAPGGTQGWGIGEVKRCFLKKTHNLASQNA